MNKKMKLLSGLGLVTAQSLSISGKVIDKNSQEPVIGASVLIEGTSNGTITDLDGNFMLSNVPSKRCGREESPAVSFSKARRQMCIRDS